MNAIWRFLRNDDGPTAVEYCIMLSAVFLAVILSIKIVGTRLNSSVGNSSTQISNATSS